MLDRRYCVFNSDILGGARFIGGDEYPIVKGTILEAAPGKVVPFDHIGEAHDKNSWLHFHVHDKRLAALYKRPQKYLRLLGVFGGVFGIDHSVYRDSPLLEQKYSVYLNRATDFWFEANGIPVVSNVSWGDSRTFAFCCEGIPKGVSISVSSYGCTRSLVDKAYFLDGFCAVLETLKPFNVFHVGRILPEVREVANHAGIPLIHIQSRQEAARMEGGR